MIHKIHDLNPSSARSIGNPKVDGVNVLEEIIAEEGKKLTQSKELPLEERIIASAVMLGKGCSSDEWVEITQEEADEILKRQEESAQQETE